MRKKQAKYFGFYSSKAKKMIHFFFSIKIRVFGKTFRIILGLIWYEHPSAGKESELCFS